MVAHPDWKSNTDPTQPARTIQDVLADALAGLPVTVKPSGIIINPNATEEEKLRIGGLIFDVSTRAAFFLNFALGDWYNALVPGEDAESKRSIIVEVFGPGRYQQAKTAGFVARHWEAPRRNPIVIWSFYDATAGLKDEEQDAYLDRWLCGEFSGVRALEDDIRQKKGRIKKPQELFDRLCRVRGNEYAAKMLERELARIARQDVQRSGKDVLTG